MHGDCGLDSRDLHHDRGPQFFLERRDQRRFHEGGDPNAVLELINDLSEPVELEAAVIAPPTASASAPRQGPKALSIDVPDR